MSATLPEALLSAEAYPHDVAAIRVVETHMSWVFLTGEYAYKVKKPVRFDFVDFSQLADRKRFCEAELELNRRFAPDLYLSVEPLVLCHGHMHVGGDGAAEPVDWAVRMRQFDTALSGDQLVVQGRMTLEELQAFARRLADQHARLPAADTDAGAPMLANFRTLAQTRSARRFTTALTELETWTRAALRRLAPEIAARARTAVRECHGDLHLGNIVRTQAGLEAFDCLEFNAGLRQIDTCSDIAFLFMDLAVRGRADLAYGFIDAYMDASGDYDALPLLNLYSVYRAVVRAKVAALRLDQTGDAAAERQLSTQISWARLRTSRPPGRLLITCGLSGSGKSHWARQMVPALAALRLRSDVLRKQLAGLAPQARSGSGLADGIYSSAHGECTYDGLAALAAALLAGGETVVVDATNLRRAQRQRFQDVAAQAGGRYQVVHFTAPDAVLLERIASRARAASDASEADAAVLAAQRRDFEPFASDEPVLTLDTQSLDLQTILRALERA